MDFKRFTPYFTLLFVVLTSTLLVWAPFLFKSESWLGLPTKGTTMLEIYKQFDGPLYIIPAKTSYDPHLIKPLLRDSVLPQEPIYFAAHLPLYPFFIRIFSYMFGYLKSMLIVNIVATILLSWLFYFVLKRLQITKHSLILASIFLFLPRFLVVRSTGAPESLFILCILASLFLFEKKKYFYSSIVGVLAVMTKAPGVLLFVAYAFSFFEEYMKTKKLSKSALWIILIPVGLVMVFGWYFLQYNDFFAFFHTGGMVPMPYPFAAFNSGAKWVGTAWLEDVLFYFFLHGLAVYQLKDTKYRSFFYFSFLFWAVTLFIQHRDISRYSLPLWPMACIAFENFFSSRKFITIFIIMLVGIYLYAWNFLAYNVMPINEWLPFL